MKAFVAVLFCSALFETALCAQNHGMSLSLEALQGVYQWQASAEQILATPEWSDQSRPVPLSLDKACQCASNWLNQHGCDGFQLQKVELLRYPPPYIGKQGEELSKRFYYRLEYHSKRMELIYVYVLLDGTVLEPKITPLNKTRRFPDAPRAARSAITQVLNHE